MSCNSCSKNNNQSNDRGLINRIPSNPTPSNPSNPTNVVNPITIYSPDLLLEPIVYDFTQNDVIKKYIISQKIPFWAKCIIENKYICLRTNNKIIIKYPKINEGENFCFSKKLPDDIKNLINIIKEYDNSLSDRYISLYLNYLKEHHCKVLDDLLLYSSNTKNNILIDALSIYSIKQLLDEYKYCPNKDLKKIVIENEGVSSINKLNYSISIKKYFRKDPIQLNIPDYIENFYNLQLFLEYIQNNKLILNSEKYEKTKDLLPRYYTDNSTTPSKTVIVQNERQYREVDFGTYLTGIKSTGSVNYVVS